MYYTKCSGYPFLSCESLGTVHVGEFVLCEECKRRLDKDMSRTLRSIKFRR